MHEETAGKKCVVCNRDGFMALVGIGIGVVFILIGLDTLRRMRIEQLTSTVDGEVEE